MVVLTTVLRYRVHCDLRDRSHNYSLINKDSHINDRHSFHRTTALQTRLLTFFYYFLTFIIFIVQLRSVNFFIKRILDWIGLDWSCGAMLRYYFPRIHVIWNQMRISLSMTA